MATILTPARNARALAGFVFNAAPILWQRLSEDRKRLVEASPNVPRIGAWPGEGVHAAWIGLSTVLIRVDGFTITVDDVEDPRRKTRLGPELRYEDRG